MNQQELIENQLSQEVTATGLLARPANQLLDDFGAGKASPGSGSAAALLGLLSAKMICTVCGISLKKDSCRDNYKTFSYIINVIENEIEPRLKELFELDAKDFEKVVELRVARNTATDPTEKARYSRESLDLLEKATDYTFEVGEISVKLMGFALSMFEHGWPTIRGDSGVALSAAMSGVMSSIFIIHLNLKTLSRRKYAESNLKKCVNLQEQLNKLQTKAFSCVSVMSMDSIDAIQFEFEST